VKASASELVMTDTEGKNQYTMQVSAGATIRRGGKEAKLPDLQAGDTITVVTATHEGKATVTRIEAEAAGKQ
jgi:hypothetical protein